MTHLIRFDESLAAFVKGLLTVVSKTRIGEGWIMRDVSGRLAFVANTSLSEEDIAKATQAVETAATVYCRMGSAVLDVNMAGVEPLVKSSYSFTQDVQTDANNSVKVRVIDHRIIGQDWLTVPVPGWQPPAPGRFVFASMKGGVGRSTAIAVVAYELANAGKKVLVVDLDLEAPGIGTMLIDEKDKPPFGVLDWFIERAISRVDDPVFLADLIAPSFFGRGKGLIDVAPALGHSSDKYPSNVLSKLARAYLELPQEKGPPISFLSLTQNLVAQLAAQKTYDAVLVDARAGLNESTAAALLGLGADILLFGVDTPQTFASYRYLLAHLASLVQNSGEDWIYQLRMVHAKASPEVARQKTFRDRAYAMFSEFLYRDQPLVDDDSGTQLTTEQFGLDDPAGPHYAWPILSDSFFAEFDPFTVQSQLTPEYYQRSYSGLLSGIRDLLGETESKS